MQNAAKTAVETTTRKANEAVNTAKEGVTLAINTIEQKIGEAIETITKFSEMMCRQECTAFYNVPCFLLFRCTDKLKRFFIILVTPIILFVLLFCGCSTGIIDLKCLYKALLYVTGIKLAIWLCKRCCCKKEDDENKTPYP